MRCFSIAFGLLALVSRQALGCSATPLTAAELVDEADTIVRAVAVSTEVRDGDSDQVKFEIREVLKGHMEGSSLTQPGYTYHYLGRNEMPPPYDFVRPGGRGGRCYARDYRIGSEYLLIMVENDVRWAALSATNEEVTGSDDPWVWWVKGFLARQAFDHERKEAARGK
jgi:hypothetical protein